MLFDFQTVTASEALEFLSATVVPRPIAMVTTLSVNGTPNAALPIASSIL
jgi:flavin reductase (DIM6/NTAB) family NADH-FMN oxidoreductase RutF